MKEAYKYLENIINKNDTIVVATSGGPDSMALLSMIISLKEKYNLNIICAHCNHGLRKESIEEANYLKKYCLDNNIIFEYTKFKDYKNNKFTESEGRKKRYLFFEEVINKYDGNILVTAHHGDDLIETILMRIVRGSNLKGYIGIPRLQDNGLYKLCRPLLYTTKNDIIKYLNDNNIKYFIDESNNNEKYTRNRYRKHMLPFLKNEDNNVHLKFLKYSNELEEANEYIERIINNKIKDIFVENYIVINNLLKEDKYIQKRIIEKKIEDIQKNDILNINDKELNNVIKLVNNKNNKSINLADGYLARKSYDKLYIEKSIINEDYEIVFNDELSINGFNIKAVKDCNDKNNSVIRINSEEIKLPLIIRNRRNGDKIKIKNLNGSKKIKDVFIDSKIDKHLRDSYPILVDSNNEILWIPNLKKSIFDKEKDEKYDIIIKCMEEDYEKE